MNTNETKTVAEEKAQRGRGKTWDSTALQLLCAAAQARSLDELAAATGIPRTTAHRRLGELLEAGLMGKVAHSFLVTDAGKAVANGAAVAEFPPRHLDRRLPVLSLLPTPTHRAIMALTFCLVIARRDNLVEDMHPALLLVGATQRLKSWVIKLCCRLLGEAPEDCEISMMEVRGRGLLARLGARGEVVYELDVLKKQIIWLNEVRRMDSQVKRDVEALMHGRKVIRVDNEQLEVVGVPMLEFNLRKTDGALEERLGFDQPMIRRCFIVDFTAVNVTRDMRAQSPEVAEAIKAHAPVALPKAPNTPLPREYRCLVEQACEECVRDECRDYIDPGRIITAILGARALLPDREATEEMLATAFLAYDTTGFMKPDWRSRCALLFTTATPQAGQAQGAAPAPAAPSLQAGETSGVSGAPDDEADEGPNPFDLDAGVLRMRHMFSQAGLESPRDDVVIQGLLGVLAGYARAGWTLQQFDRIMRESGMSAEDMQTLALLAAALREKGWTSQDLDNALTLVNHLEALELGVDEGNGLFEALRAAARAGGERQGAGELLLSAAREGFTLRQHHDALESSVAALERRRNECAEAATHMETRKARAQAACRAVEEELARLKALRERAWQVSNDFDEALKAQQEHLAASRELLAAVRAAGKHLQGRSCVTLAVSQLLLTMDAPPDSALSEGLRDFLLARETGNNAWATPRLQEIARRAEELLRRVTFPDAELEALRRELLEPQRQFSAAGAPAAVT